MNSNTDDLPEKKIGDLTVAVVPAGRLNGPYQVVVFGGGSPRTLASRFETVEQAAEYLRHVSSRDLMRSRGNPEGSILDSIRPGMRVTIVNHFGRQQSGKAVMRGPGGWVLNLGGPHGTPGIADEHNIVKVAGKPSGLGGLALTGTYRNPASRSVEVRHSIGYPTKGEALAAKKRLEAQGGGPYRISREGRSGYSGGWWWSVVGPRAANPAGPSAIPANWTPAVVSRKGGQIQIRMGGK